MFLPSTKGRNPLSCFACFSSLDTVFDFVGVGGSKSTGSRDIDLRLASSLVMNSCFEGLADAFNFEGTGAAAGEVLGMLKKEERRSLDCDIA